MKCNECKNKPICLFSKQCQTIEKSLKEKMKEYESQFSSEEKIPTFSVILNCDYFLSKNILNTYTTIQPCVSRSTNDITSTDSSINNLKNVKNKKDNEIWP